MKRGGFTQGVFTVGMGVNKFFLIKFIYLFSFNYKFIMGYSCGFTRDFRDEGWVDGGVFNKKIKLN